MSVVFHLVLGKEQAQNEGKIFISTALLVLNVIFFKCRHNTFILFECFERVSLSFSQSYKGDVVG